MSAYLCFLFRAKILTKIPSPNSAFAFLFSEFGLWWP
ncbi:hypothetical protein OIU78_019601, partial [Salix suchowensis]